METILSIAGKPGLYKLVSRGKMNLIVEAVDSTHRRQPAFASDRVTSLGDIAMYTDADDIPLWQVLENVGKKETARRLQLITRRLQPRNCRRGLLMSCQTGIATVFITVILRNSSSGMTFLSRPA